MSRLLIAGILISAMPLSAQGLGIVGEQMNQALQGKDKKKFEELVQKQSELEKNLGPEYRGLVESLGKVNLTPKDGQEIVSMFDTLDDSCPH